MYKKTKRSRIYCKKTPCPINKTKIKKEIKKESKIQEGVTAGFINNALKLFPNFLGCFAQDQLKHLIIRSLPVSLIVNFDYSSSKGSHWVAIRIDRKRLEIFDPLGFNVRRWPNIPIYLIDFLHKFAIHRRVLISREIQPQRSSLCGFYCIFFIYFRIFNSFADCTNIFSINLYKNDYILTDFFNKL